MNEIDIQSLAKIKNDISYNKNNNRKNKIKINSKSLIFIISILINISFFLKLSFDYIFSITKKNNLKIVPNFLLTDFSNISNASNLSKNDNYSNDNRPEHRSHDNNSEYRLNDSYSDYDLILLDISNILQKKITKIDIIVLIHFFSFEK